MPKINKTEKEWHKLLSKEQYKALREKATEPPFSGEYDQLFDSGRYTCAACGSKLFESDTKFDAHCGWPSFYDAIPGSVEFYDDNSFGMSRTKVNCATCGSHLGHVFQGEGFDNPTDVRFCVNSLSLKFQPKKPQINN